MERITSRKNPKIQHIRKLGASREYRRQCGEFLCDGKKLLQEAISNNFDITSVLHCGELPDNIPDGCRIYETDREIIEYASPMKSPQEVLFTCEMKRDAKNFSDTGKYIILEGVQDPGNVGTVIRTARAMGFAGVLLLPGCADLYSPKTVRATMGAIFRQNVCEIEMDDIVRLKASGIPVYGAALTSTSRDIRSVNLKNAAVCIGSEGNGLSQELLDMCDEKVIIPMMEECESLNAAMAAGIIMWETVR